MSKILYVFTDGGASGNPGPAAAAFIVKDSRGKILVKNSKFIGQATNNVAEYTGVIEALKWIKKNREFLNCQNVQFSLDSKLVVSQLNGLFKIKNKNLRNLIVEARKLEQEIGGNFSYRFIPREKNCQTDFLVGQILAESNP